MANGKEESHRQKVDLEATPHVYRPFSDCTLGPKYEFGRDVFSCASDSSAVVAGRTVQHCTVSRSLAQPCPSYLPEDFRLCVLATPCYGQVLEPDDREGSPRTR